MANPYLQRMARVLVQYSLGIKKGDRLGVETTSLGMPLAREVVREVVRAGAHPEVLLQVPDVSEILLREGTDEQVLRVSMFQHIMYKECETLLRIRADHQAQPMADIDPARLALTQQARGTLTQILMERAVKDEIPPSMRYEWTELALLQLQTGNTAMYVFVLAVVLVFLVLAAQYESWSLPLAVILVVPMCLLCSVAGVQLAGIELTIFTQIGFVVLVGLACKNAILIVQFAKAERERGVPRFQATLNACKLRLRPIIMTSLAFILGVLPLIISTGAGAEMRRTLGTAVFAGMLGVTLFGIFLTPVFFYVIQWATDLRLKFKQRREGAPIPEPSVVDVSWAGDGDLS